MKNKDHVTHFLLLVLVIGVIVESTLPATVGDQFFPHMDKVVHFFSYGVIAWLCASLINSYRMANIAYILVCAFLFVVVLGAVAEWLQSHTPGRLATINDLYADMAGALLFLMLWHYRVKRIARL